MISFPASVHAIVANATAKHPNNVETAAAEAESGVRRLPEYDALVQQLVSHAIRNLVYAQRHHNNCVIKNRIGAYDTKPKVSATSPTVKAVYEDIYGWHMAGKTLGIIKGSELEGCAASEESIANGHTLNAKLLRALRPLVKDEQAVREAVPAKKLQRLWERIKKENAAGDAEEVAA